jgi:hypothetical protein
MKSLQQSFIGGKWRQKPAASRLHEDDLSTMLLGRRYRHLSRPFIAPEA